MWKRVTEDELQLYVDRRLPRPREAAVEAHLDANPAEAARIDAYGHLNDLLHDLGEAIDAELPRAGALRLHRVIAEHAAVKRRRRRTGTVAATLVLAAVLSVAGIETFHAKVGPTIARNASASPAMSNPAAVEPVAAERPIAR